MAEAGVPQAYSLGARALLNQYESAAGFTLTHDLNGSVVTRIPMPGVEAPRLDLLHDALNRPARVTMGTWPDYDSVTHLAYDALNRRVGKVILRGTASESVTYLLDGERVTEDLDDAGVATLRVFGGWGLDDLVLQVKQGARAWVLTDTQASVIKVFDDDQDLLEQFSYADYGEPSRATTIDGTFVAGETSAHGVSQLFASGWYDEESGLYWLRTRFMDPQVGRFMERDPAGVWFDAASMGNGYTYAANNPGTMVDPLGMYSLPGDSFTGTPQHGGGGLGGGWPEYCVVCQTAEGASTTPTSNEEEVDKAAEGATGDEASEGGGPPPLPPSLTPEDVREALRIAGHLGQAAFMQASAGLSSQGFDAATADAAMHQAKAQATEYLGRRDWRPNQLMFVCALFGGAFVAPELIDPSPVGEVKLVGKAAKASGALDAVLGRLRAAFAHVRDRMGACFLAGTLVHTSGGAMAIEHVRLGDRVIADHEGSTETSPIDPSRWRHLRLVLVEAASGDVHDIELLRPVDALSALGCSGTCVGGEQAWLTLPDIGVEGRATVLWSAPCPAIAPGPGRVVTGTFQSWSTTVVRLTMTDGEVVWPTAGHLLFSEDRAGWAPAGDLQSGERLGGLGDVAEVLLVEPVRDRMRVYNLEVQGVHQYHVGAAALLAHNTSSIGGRATRGGAAVGRGGRALELRGGQLTESGFLRQADEYLGAGYREVSPGRYVSADGMRQVRYGVHEVRSAQHHGHFEAYDQAGGRVVENTVVEIVSDPTP